MAEQALYREWRPLTFDDVVEQEHVTTALQQAIVTDSIAHAYLFTGTRGTGKTSMAKILSRAVNCLNPLQGNPCNQCEVCQGILDGSLLDVTEIDAASNTSVDNIRRIIEESIFLPVKARYKVYIIDEVHMLSQGAFNALLKTLEEPPAHVIFVLATTEPQRIPATILSRCQRYDFHRISDAGMTERLKQIATHEKIGITQDGLEEITSLADGAMRDAISLLDQAAVSFPDGADADDIASMAGEASPAELARLVRLMAQGQGGELLLELDNLIRQGQDLTRLTHDLARTYRNLLIVHAAQDPRCTRQDSLRSLLRARESDLDELRELAAYYSQPEVVTIIRDLAQLAANLRWSTDPRTLLEIELLKLSGTRRQPYPAPQPEIAATAAAPTAQPAEPATPVAAPAEPVTAPAPSDPAEQTAVVEPQTVAAAQAPAPTPVLQQQSEAQTAAVTAYTDEESTRLWQQALEQLREIDVFTYMFAQEASARPGKEGLELHLSPGHEAHYNVLNSDRGAEPLRQAFRQAAGHEINYRIVGPVREAKRPTVDWIEQLADTAQELGIPVERED